MKHTMRKVLTVLVAICLFSVSGTVLAAEGDNPTIDLGTVETTYQFGVVEEDYKTSGSEYAYKVSSGNGEQYTGRSDEPYGEITVNADSIDVDTSSTNPASGVVVDNGTPSDVTFHVNNDINVTDKPEDSLSATAYGINIESEGNGSAVVDAANVSAAAEAKDNVSVQGIAASTGDKGKGTVSINVGDVTASASANSTKPISDWPKASATGLDLENTGTMTVNAGNISTSAKGASSEISESATGILLYNAGNAVVTAGDVNAKANEATGIIVESYPGVGGSTSSVTDVRTENISVSGSFAKGMDVSSSLGSTASVETGNITVAADSEKALLIEAYGISTVGKTEGVQGTTNIKTGDVTVQSKGDAAGINAVSIGGYDHGTGQHYIGSANVEAGSVSVTVDNAGSSDKTHHVYGIDVNVQGSTATVKTGDVMVNADYDAVGVLAIANSTLDWGNKQYIFGTANVETSNITAAGEGSIGIMIQGEQIKENVDPASQINIIANGTVNGDDVAVRVVEESSDLKFDTDNINLTVWSINENKDGEIIRVIKTETKDGGTAETTDKEASKAMESRINYIVKVADGVMPKIAVTTAKGNTVIIGGDKFNTANEKEEVTLNITLAEDEVLEGIYYNNDDAATLTTVDKLFKDSKGGYVLNMLRGGGMLVGLKIHKHTPGAAVTENIVAATCTTAGSYDSVVYCSECGAELSRTKVVVPAKGHTPGSPVLENVTVSGYDNVVYCIICGAELSRTHTSIIPPAPEPTPAVPATVFRFVAVDENTVIHGVKVADHQPIEDVFAIVGKTLDDENAASAIRGVDKILNADELARFDQLGAKDKLNVVLTILVKCGVVKADVGEMSDDVKALAADIGVRIDGMSEEARTQFVKQVKEIFNFKTEVIDGVEHDTIGIEWSVEKDGQILTEKFSFYDDKDVWKLYKIEIGDYYPV